MIIRGTKQREPLAFPAQALRRTLWRITIHFQTLTAPIVSKPATIPTAFTIIFSIFYAYDTRADVGLRIGWSEYEPTVMQADTPDDSRAELKHPSLGTFISWRPRLELVV